MKRFLAGFLLALVAALVVWRRKAGPSAGRAWAPTFPLRRDGGAAVGAGPIEGSAPAPEPAAGAPEPAVGPVDVAEADLGLPAGAVRGDGGRECPPDYPIKGNAGSMIYHPPGTGSYAATIPEFCFASAELAEAAGFRAPRTGRGAAGPSE